MSSAEHIHPDFRHVFSLFDRERINFMDQPRWISYGVATKTFDHLQGLLNKPARPRMPSTLIVGEPNNGKTTIVQRFYELCGQPSVSADADPVKPVILAQAPPSADEKSLYLSILNEFYAPHRASDPVSKLRYQVVHLFRACNVRLLIIDEFHSLLTGSAIKQREVMNAIKFLCNELAIPIVGVGTRDAVRVLHTDPQHASRFDVMPIPNWELNPNFQKLLANFEAIIPLKQPSRLAQPELASLVHSISGGVLGNVHRLIMECAIQAITTGKEKIDKKTIQDNSWLRPTAGIRERLG